MKLIPQRVVGAETNFPLPKKDCRPKTEYIAVTNAEIIIYIIFRGNPPPMKH